MSMGHVESLEGLMIEASSSFLESYVPFLADQANR